KLANAEGLRALGERVADLVDGEGGGALASVHQAERAWQQLERMDGATAEWRTMIDNAYLALEELARSAREYARGLDDDPARLAELENRRAVLDRLAQKYGPTLAAVMAAKAEAAAELDLLDRAEFDLQTLAASRLAADRA